MRTAKRRTADHLPIVLAGAAAAGLLLLVGVGTVAWFLLSRPASPSPAAKGDVSAKPPAPLPSPVRNPNPTADKEGLSWSLKDLGEHLKAKGAIAEYELPASEDGSFFGRAIKNPMLAKVKGGRVVEVRRHDGAISAEQHLLDDYRDISRLGIAYCWGAFTVQNADRNGDAAESVAPALPGCRTGRQVHEATKSK